MTLHGALLSMEFFLFCGTIDHPGDIVILLWLTRLLQNFAQHILPLAGTVHSGMVSYPSVASVNLEVYLFGRTFPVSSCCAVQVVTSLYTVQGRSVPEDCINHDGAQLSHQW